MKVKAPFDACSLARRLRLPCEIPANLGGTKRS
jgi:hypothetical protein